MDLRTAGRGAACGVALAVLGACGRRAEPAQRPNFVLILADDLGWADVGFQGSRFHRTPRIDQLARDGLAFSQAYAAAPVCSAARAGLLTGQTPARLHLTVALGPHSPTEDADSRMDEAEAGALLEPTVVDRLPDVPTLGSALQAEGYETAWIGKWHLGEGLRAHGFELEIGASTAGAVTSYFSPYGLPTLPDGPKGEYLTDRLTDEAVRFLETKHERPFLLVLAHYAPHIPLQAPPALVAEYQARADGNAPQHNPIYAAMIERLDASVGRVRETLERLGLAPSTLLVFTSDNGAFEEMPLDRRHKDAGKYAITSNLPLRSGKGRLYEGGLRVPWIVWGGPVARGGTSRVPVIQTDLLPTFLALAGAPALAVCDGLDLAPLLGGEGSLARDALYFHFPHQSFQSALRHGDEKLLYSWRTERAELYDLAADPGELHDLARERPERVAALQADLFRWLDAVGAGRPTRAVGEKAGANR